LKERRWLENGEGGLFGLAKGGGSRGIGRNLIHGSLWRYGILENHRICYKSCPELLSLNIRKQPNHDPLQPCLSKKRYVACPILQTPSISSPEAVQIGS